MKLLTILLSVIVLSAVSLADITFTGDASVDFGPGSIWALDNNGEGDVLITQAMQNAGILSGWDILRVGFYYDWDTDIMYVGVDYHGRVCGDADGDGDPGAETYLTGNNTDVPDLGEGETVAIWLDTDNSGGPNGYDVIAGVPINEDYTGFCVCEAVGGWGNPFNSFGDPILTSAGSYLFANPSAAQPDFEFTITNFTQLPGISSLEPDSTGMVFGVYIYSGSFVDGGVGYDKLIDCWVTINFPPNPAPDSITHYYPRDLYVMEGIPLQVENGDPPTLFGYPFNAYPPGWPYWRVSRWNSELQTYERYQEENWPINIGGDPPDQEPGLGFWVVQDVEVNPVIEIGGIFFEPGDQVTQLLQHPYSDGRRGLSQIANPFHTPIIWGDTWIQPADSSAPPMSIEEAANDGIISRYAISWDTYQLQYIVNDLDAVLNVWTGFWVEQYDLNQEYNIGFDFPTTTDWRQGIPTGATSPFETDDYSQWSFSLGLTVESLGHFDCHNFLGISPDAVDLFDQLDASEFAPQVTEGGYVHLYFPHEDWTDKPGYYAFDFRNGPYIGEKEWEFIVRSYQYSGVVTLSWDGVAKITPEYQASLLDDQGNILVADLTLAENTTITIGAEEEKHFSIRVEGFGSGAGRNGSGTPADFAVFKVSPNPFNNATKIEFSLDKPMNIQLAVFDINGRLVKIIAEGEFFSGEHSEILDFQGLASGIYFLKVASAGKALQTQKLVLMK